MWVSVTRFEGLRLAVQRNGLRRMRSRSWPVRAEAQVWRPRAAGFQGPWGGVAFRHVHTCRLGTLAGRLVGLGLASFSGPVGLSPQALPWLGESPPHQEGDPRDSEAVACKLRPIRGGLLIRRPGQCLPRWGSPPACPMCCLAAGSLGGQAVTTGTRCCCRAS